MKAGQWPALPDRGGGVLVGGDTGELEPATAGQLSTDRGDVVREKWWSVRLVSSD